AGGGWAVVPMGCAPGVAGSVSAGCDVALPGPMAGGRLGRAIPELGAPPTVVATDGVEEGRVPADPAELDAEKTTGSDDNPTTTTIAIARARMDFLTSDRFIRRPLSEFGRFSG
ncbi:MAG TPA: hypothetical protein VEE83_00690, partial [Thermoplasmata archaeon]|nr:hypothetical protein [Thermoplasmata archaeon]